MLTVSKGPKGAAYSVTRCEFSDLNDVLAGAHTAPVNAGYFADKLDHIASSGSGEWFGNIGTLADATALFRDGWQDGARNAAVLAPQLAHVVPPVKDTRRRVRWADDGCELHIDRALAGQWENAWRTTRREAQACSRVVSLGCNFGGGAHVSHSQLFWCAAQMIVATDMLEQAGYAVELRALKCNHIRGNQHVLLDVLVKRPDQPLRPDAVAAVFGHAGVYRTAGHMLLMTAPWDVGSSLGSPIDVASHVERATRDGLMAPVDYVLERAHDVGTAARNLTAALVTLTGEPADV